MAQTASPTPVEYKYIISTPGTCGGRPRIDGHRIRVQDVVACYTTHGESPEEICENYPGITLAQVHAALAYYFDHREDLEMQWREDEAAIAQFIADNPNSVRTWEK